MSESAAKRMKYYAELEESIAREREGMWDQETQQALEEIDACQNQIDSLNETASEDILKVEQKYNKLRKPFFEKRNRIIQKIENFWITAFVNHPQITALLDEDEEDCLHNLSKLEVEEFDDIKFGYSIKFYFEPNQYFENDVLVKEFHLGAPIPCSKSTPIIWKQGQNIVRLIKERNERNQKQGKKRKPESRTFFIWYEEDCDPTADEIAEVIKDDLWPNPLQYYLSPDIEVDANGVEDDGADDDDASEEDCDNSVVIIDDGEDGTNEDEDDEDVVVDCNIEDKPIKDKSADTVVEAPAQETIVKDPLIPETEVPDEPIKDKSADTVVEAPAQETIVKDPLVPETEVPDEPIKDKSADTVVEAPTQETIVKDPLAPETEPEPSTQGGSAE